MQLTFLGATGTVTGSKYLLEAGDRQLLIDCGLFQGYKQLRLRNWDPPRFSARKLDAILLTHAHIDHSGYVPLAVKHGFDQRIYCTPATLELCGILLPDSGFLQEEQARFANRHEFSKHSPALPLYTKEDADASLAHLHAQSPDEDFEPCHDVIAQFTRAGHLLGAASVRLEHNGVRVTFSGDLGRYNDPIMHPPAAPLPTDYLVIESTYGDRLHPEIDAERELLLGVKPALARGGVVVVPAFAIGRAQTVLLTIARLKAKDLLPDVPVFLDSPMAIDATTLYRIFRTEHRLNDEDCALLSHAARMVRTTEQSKTLSASKGPMIIVSASGMATGGRVVHHLKAFCGDERNLILLTGYQAGGTRGAALANGVQQLRIHGREWPVRAEVSQLSASSGHADANELLTWLRQMPQPPRKVFVTHGEPSASDALRQRIERELRWNVVVPEYRDTVELA